MDSEVPVLTRGLEPSTRLIGVVTFTLEEDIINFFEYLG